MVCSVRYRMRSTAAEKSEKGAFPLPPLAVDLRGAILEHSNIRGSAMPVVVPAPSSFATISELPVQ